MSKNINVVFIRHAQSTWNAENRFTGWANPPLTQLGIDEAHKAARILAASNLKFDKVYSSILRRATQTAEIIMQDTASMKALTIDYDWRLNERHYGSLQGLDKKETAEKFGEKQVLRWRRGYTDKADALATSDQRHPQHDELFKHVPKAKLPSVESLADTRLRVTEFWNDVALKDIKQGKNMLISSHGNTLRALIMELAKLSIEDVEAFEIPTGLPILYRFSPEGEPLDWEFLSAEKLKVG